MSTVVTGPVRLSFVNLFEPRSPGLNDDGTPQPPKYSVQLLIPKKDAATIAKLRAAEKATAEEKKAVFIKGKVPAELKSVLRDGDLSDLEEYPERAGHWYMSVTAKEKYPPALVTGPNREDVVERSEIYSGCYAKVSLNPFAYNVKGNQGISFGIRAVWKQSDGEPLGGAGSASSRDFEDEKWEGEDLI